MGYVMVNYNRNFFLKQFILNFKLDLLNIAPALVSDFSGPYYTVSIIRGYLCYMYICFCANVLIQRVC